MYSKWYQKYVYNKIKMKNLPILLTFYWLSVQIFTIASLFNGLVLEDAEDSGLGQ